MLDARGAEGEPHPTDESHARQGGSGVDAGLHREELGADVVGPGRDRALVGIRREEGPQVGVGLRRLGPDLELGGEDQHDGTRPRGGGRRVVEAPGLAPPERPGDWTLDGGQVREVAIVERGLVGELPQVEPTPAAVTVAEHHGRDVDHPERGQPLPVQEAAIGIPFRRARDRVTGPPSSVLQRFKVVRYRHRSSRGRFGRTSAGTSA